MVYLEQLSEELESLTSYADTWKGRKMPGEKISTNSFLSPHTSPHLTYGVVQFSRWPGSSDYYNTIITNMLTSKINQSDVLLSLEDKKNSRNLHKML